MKSLTIGILAGVVLVGGYLWWKSKKPESVLIIKPLQPVKPGTVAAKPTTPPAAKPVLVAEPMHRGFDGYGYKNCCGS